MKNDPEKCDKRQREVKRTKEGEETEQHRCVEKNASVYLEIVDAPTCEGCPLLAAKLSDKGCGGRDWTEPHWSDELLSTQKIGHTESMTLHMSEAQQGFVEPCHHRWEGKCRITGLPITPEICKACDQETADHMATLPEMAIGYAKEVKQWIREGRPVRTDEEVAERLSICKGDPMEGRPPCKLYDPVKEACNKCGCGASESSWPLLNGIRMKTKVCPMKLWS